MLGAHVALVVAYFVAVAAATDWQAQADAKSGIVIPAPALQRQQSYSPDVSGTSTDAVQNAIRGLTQSNASALGIIATSPQAGAVDVPASTAIGITFDAAPELEPGEASKVVFALSAASGGDDRAVLLEDTDQVLLQGPTLVVVLRSPLLVGVEYSCSFQLLPGATNLFDLPDFELRFSTRDDGGGLKPVVLRSYPAGLQSKLGLRGVAPYVEFSQAVVPAPGRQIVFRNALQEVQYTIQAEDEDCGISGTTADACIVIDATRSKVSFYPLGVDAAASSQAADWAQPGTTYYVELEAGAFTSQLKPGAAAAGTDAFSLLFAVSGDTVGPQLLSSIPSNSSALDPTGDSVFLTFNEVVQPGDSSFAILVKAASGPQQQPAVTAAGPRYLADGWGQTIVVSFDVAVQGSSAPQAAFQVRSSIDEAVLAEVPVADATFAGQRAFFNVPFAAPQGPAVTQEFYVTTTSADTVQSLEGLALAEALDSRGLALAPSGAEGLVHLWSTADGHLCFSANGVLPDLVLFMSLEVQSIMTSKLITLVDCGSAVSGTCAATGGVLWTLPARLGGASQEAGSIRVGVTDLFKVTIGTGSLASGIAGAAGTPLQAFHRYRLDLEAGLFESLAGVASSRGHLEFSVCEVRYDVPASSLVRLYSLDPFATSTPSGPRRFDVVAPTTALTDSWGNQLPAPFSLLLVHETEPLRLDASACNPPGASGVAGPNTSLILAFDRAIQSGSGKLELVDAGADAVALEVEASLLAEFGLLHGRHVVITPEALCAIGATCSTLAVGRSYYARTTTAGVFQDDIGNPLPAMNTQSTWSFNFAATTAAVPEIATVAASKLLPPEENVYPARLICTLLLTVWPVTPTSAAAISSANLQDCGPDFDCQTLADNGVVLLPAELDVDESVPAAYALVTVSRFLKTTDRRYKVTVQPDTLAAPDSTTGPSSSYTFEVVAGSLPPGADALDKVSPRLGHKVPRNTQTAVAVGTDLVMHFSEDVQRGTGSVYLCLNSDAIFGTSGTPQRCDLGAFADGSPTVLDIADAVIDRRRVTFNPTQDLAPNQQLYVQVPAGLVQDASANNNTKVEATMYTFTVRAGDVQGPMLDYYTTPTSASTVVALHFNEAVQLGIGSASVWMEFPFGEVPVLLEGIAVVDERIVTVAVSWQVGQRYRLELPRALVMDKSGNTMDATVSIPMFLVDPAGGSPVASAMNATSMDAAYAAVLVASAPANESSQVVSTTSFKVLFAEPVQAGVGNITFSTLQQAPLATAVDSCIFVDSTMICLPPATLERNAAYQVLVPAGAVNLATGAALGVGDIIFGFTTLDLDLTPPRLLTASSDPADGAAGIGPGQVLRLVFSEPVQAGEGAIVLRDCSPGNRSLCYDGGVTESTPDAEFTAIDISGNTPGTLVWFEGTTLFVAKQPLTLGTRYSLQTSAEGVVVDEAGLPLAPVIAGQLEFEVVVDDVEPPRLLAMSPYNASIGEVPPGADMLLYFSEAVQAAPATQALAVSIGIEGGGTELVPVAGTGASGTGRVHISGALVTIDAYYEEEYGQLVTVTIPPGAFLDLAGNVFQGILPAQPYQWQTTVPVFTEVRAQEVAQPFSPRQDAVLHHVQGRLMLFGGRQGSTCYSDAFTSVDGVTWASQGAASSDSSITLPAMAGAASAADATGCIWLVGGCGAADSRLWKSCSVGATWQPLPAPTSRSSGVSWPAAFDGQAIAILGGWQLVLLDLVRGDFWLFTDRSATTVVRTAEMLPFAPRRGATLLASSGGDLYLVGGHDCNDDACSNGKVYTDVWKSAQSMYVGRDWVCQTADYTAMLPVWEQQQLGRRDIAVAMTRDDTIHIVGGQQLASGSGVASMFTFVPGVPDVAFDASQLPAVPTTGAPVSSPGDSTRPTLVSQEPPAEAEPQHGLPTSTSLLFTFSETVQAGPGGFTFETQQPTGGGGSSAAPLYLAAQSDDVVIGGNRVLLLPPSGLAPGQVYSIVIDSTAIADGAGNYFAGLASGQRLISTAPRMRLVLVESAPFSGTPRYGAAATVDESNRIFVVGGADGATGTPLNSVWRLDTRRHTHCGAYPSSSLECSETSCSGSPSTMGNWTAEQVVWRTPSAQGRRCVAADGTPQSQAGQLLAALAGSCSCPECPAPPPPLPQNMVNESYLAAYAGTPGALAARQVECATGYHAAENFVCRAESEFVARWDMPYPECLPPDCVTPPPAVQFEDPSSAAACAGVSLEAPKAHNDTCPMRCLPGYRPVGVAPSTAVFRCLFGEYVSPACEPMRCTEVPGAVPNGTLSSPCGALSVGMSCTVTCDPGFQLVGSPTVSCEATSAVPESEPQLLQPGQCVPQSCGTLQLSDPRGVVTGYSDTQQFTGSTASVGCQTGYEISFSSFDSFDCMAGADESAWVGSLTCVRRSCNVIKPALGYFVCPQGVLLDETCQLECEVGYTLLGGSGVFTCGADGQLTGSGSCAAMPCGTVPWQAVDHATSTDCPSTLTDTGEACTVACEEGYEVVGSFLCRYGGFSQRPACIPDGSDSVRLLDLVSVFVVTVESSTRSAESLTSDQSFWTSLEKSIADGLNRVQLNRVVVQNVVSLSDFSGGRRLGDSGSFNLWVSFKVRAANNSNVEFWLTTQQAVTKSRFMSSLQERYSGVFQVAAVVLAAPKPAVEFAEVTTVVVTEPEPGFFDRLTSAEDVGAAAVIGGGIGGIALAAICLLCCVCCYRRQAGPP